MIGIYEETQRVTRSKDERNQGHEFKFYQS